MENKDFIDHIKERLADHEPDYKEGAWENFLLRQKADKLIRLKRFVAVAASVILCAAIGYAYFLHDDHKSLIDAGNSIAIANPVIKDSTLSIPDSNHSLNTKSSNPLSTNHKNINLSSNKIVMRQPIIVNTKTADFTHAANRSSQAINLNNQHNNNGTVQNNTNINLSGSNSSKEAIVGISKSNEAQNTNANPLHQKDLPVNNSTAINKNGDVQNPPAKETGKLYSFDQPDNPFEQTPSVSYQKWQMGVVIAPSVGGDNKMNLGYGLAVGYRLNKHFSLNSGLTYSELSGSKSVSAGDVVVTENRSIKSVEGNITGLNVPLEVRYHINEALYVGAGVSALAVLSHSEQNNYEVNTAYADAFVAKNGNILKPQSIATINMVQKTEQIPNNQIGNNNFAGFMNFTFGIKQKLGKKKTIALEPYMSVPMSNHISNQNIHFTDAGLRVKLGF